MPILFTASRELIRMINSASGVKSLSDSYVSMRKRLRGRREKRKDKKKRPRRNREVKEGERSKAE